MVGVAGLCDGGRQGRNQHRQIGPAGQYPQSRDEHADAADELNDRGGGADRLAPPRQRIRDQVLEEFVFDDVRDTGAGERRP